MRTVRITPRETKDGKGRSFGAVLLAVLAADVFPEARVGRDLMRPVWAAFACSDGEAAPFVSNLRTGRTVDVMKENGTGHDYRLEFLRSLEYRYDEQRFDAGRVVTAYLPDLIRTDPGMVDPAGVRFALLTPTAWCAAQGLLDRPAMLRHAAECGLAVNREDPEDAADYALAIGLAPVASSFAAHLDRRTRAPLLTDPAFHLQLLLACLRDGLASLPAADFYGAGRGFGRSSRLSCVGWGAERAGVSHPLVFSADHAAVEAVLAEQVDAYYRVRGARRG